MSSLGWCSRWDVLPYSIKQLVEVKIKMWSQRGQRRRVRRLRGPALEAMDDLNVQVAQARESLECQPPFRPCLLDQPPNRRLHVGQRTR